MFLLNHVVGPQLVFETHAPSGDVSTFLEEWALVCIDLIHGWGQAGSCGARGEETYHAGGDEFLLFPKVPRQKSGR